MTALSATLRPVLATVLLAGALAACSTAEPPAREPMEEQAAPAAAPEPSAPAPEAMSSEETEIEAGRRMEEAVERVPVAESLPAEQADSVLEVLFEAGTAVLNSDARAELDRMYERLVAQANDFYLDVQGHTDPTGSEAANRRLAEQRAEAVRRYLHREKGVPLERIGATAHGSAVPVALNHSPEGREQNRRAVVVVLLPP